jgi:hypothetical protein
VDNYQRFGGTYCLQLEGGHKQGCGLLKKRARWSVGNEEESGLEEGTFKEGRHKDHMQKKA